MKSYLLNQARRLPQPVKNSIRSIQGLYYRFFINKIRQKQYPKVNFDPILIYQMGKVGSTTVEQSLLEAYKKMGIRVPIYRYHILNNFDVHEQISRNNRPNIAETLAELNRGRILRKRIDNDKSTRWKIISLVRDPLAKTVAAFFQLINEFFPDWKKQFENGELTVDSLYHFFLSRMLGFNSSGNWFDAQIKAVFEFDVFAEPFPIETGYKIFSNQRADLLLIRLEDLNTCAGKAIQEFLGIENFEILITNVGREKEYASLYQEFRSKPFPKEYVIRWYDTQYAKHFYSDEERMRFIKRWVSQN